MYKAKRLREVPIGILLALAGAGFQSCSDSDFDPVDNQNPTINIAAKTIHVEQGKTFSIKGNVKDADGIKSIRLSNVEMQLVKTIDLLDIYGDSQVHDYNLDYSFKAADT